ncbi:MAG TPA: cytochrome c [Terriglobia bacterium]|nr:cytochrome c [Terriglobia bacterium]
MRFSSKHVILIWGAAALVVFGTLSTNGAQQPPTVRQGVYTAAQAGRGAALYRAQCASCHGNALEGRSGPPLTGDEFIRTWEVEPLSELAGKIRNTMPQGDPGKLTRNETADLVTFILQTGQFPTGAAELSPDESALKQIVWPATGASKTATAPVMTFPAAGNMAQVMRGILFPSANIIFTVQSVDPGAPRKPAAEDAAGDGGFNWAVWGGGIYPPWEMVDYAAIAISESAAMMMTPGRRCENGKPVPIDDPEWQKFTQELADAGKAAYKASQTRNQEAVSESTNQLNDSCLHCHQMYRDKRRRGVDPLDPTNKAGHCVK